jgi:cytochrome c oxidase assembly factor CtaG
VILGGRALLFGIAQHHGLSLVVLAVLFILQMVALRRNHAQGGPLAPLRSTRDVAFLAAIVLAALVVASPQRWSIGATIIAVEIGLVLDILGRLTPIHGLRRD